jgi:hypothetical protein
MLRLSHPVYLFIRLVFVSRLTPILVLLIASVAFLMHAVLPHEPSESNIVQAFAGWKTKSFEAGPTPGIGNITKKSCARVTEADGYLCELQYTMQRLSGPAVTVTQVHRLFPTGDGSWGQQTWTSTVKHFVAVDGAWREGHAFWTLAGYTVCSVLGALLLCSVLPSVPWNAPGMNTRATPRASYAIRSGSGNADNIADLFTRGANTLTPAAAMALFSMTLAVGGFLLGSWVLPEAFIDLRYMRWIERLCLLVSGLSWAAVAFCLPMLIARLVAVGVVVFALYAVLVLPTMWIFTGSGPGQTISRHIDAIERSVKSASPVTAGAAASSKAGTVVRREGFEGYRQLLTW